MPNGRSLVGWVNHRATHQRLFAAAREAFGALDVLGNNAGIYEFSPLENVTAEHFHKQFDLNVLGLLLASREAVIHSVEERHHLPRRIPVFEQRS